jgi:hypothetical protein
MHAEPHFAVRSHSKGAVERPEAPFNYHICESNAQVLCQWGWSALLQAASGPPFNSSWSFRKFFRAKSGPGIRSGCTAYNFIYYSGRNKLKQLRKDCANMS